jgi:hypothetical protein
LVRIGPPDHSAKTHRNPLLPGDKEAGFAGPASEFRGVAATIFRFPGAEMHFRLHKSEESRLTEAPGLSAVAIPNQF